MTTQDLQALFEKYENEYELTKFEHIPNPWTKCRDLFAFKLLDDLLPQTYHIIGGAEHDQIFLSIDPEELAAKITEEQVLTLIRCGVCYTEDDGFYMLV